MKLEPYTARLREDLLSAAALGDEQTKSTAAALGAAAESSARLVLLDALTDFAAELTSHLDGQTIRVHLENGDPHPEVRRDPSDPTSEHPKDPSDGHADFHSRGDEYPTMNDVGGEVRRVTLRLVEQIKERAEVAASSNGISLNTWLQHAVQGALRDQMRSERHRNY